MTEVRVAQAVATARELLEEEGPEGISMRRVAARMGIRAPSLYKHVPDKAALEVQLTIDGLRAFGAALSAGGPELAGLAAAYRAWALAHPHLYLFMTQRPLPRDRLPEGLEDSAGRPLVQALGDEHTARAAWASAHGLASLEIAGRFPPDADLDAAWAALVRAYGASSLTSRTRG